MIFISFDFWIFFGLCYSIYLCLRKRIPVRNAFLLLVGYIYYAAFEWKFLGLLLFSTVIGYSIGLLLPLCSRAQKKLLLGLGVAAHLCMLGVFKYCNFFAENAALLLTHFGLRADWGTLHIILPVGISFFTFQVTGYMIDVYRGAQKPQRNFLTFALFAGFFPQLAAGPIERAAHMFPQFESVRPLNRTMLQEGIYLIVWGLVLKICIADNAAFFANGTFDDPSVPAAMIGSLAFTLQILADFSGYSCIAKGLGLLMGFDLVWNFRSPYFSKSPQEFWRRWHMSLSGWFRDYVYIPLGGNRHGNILTCRNLIITMMLVGLWHGAQWNFIAWGLYQGILLVLYRAAGSFLRKQGWVISSALSSFAGIPVFFALTVIGWTMFRSENLSQFWMIVRAVHFPVDGWQHFWMTVSTVYFRPAAYWQYFYLAFLWIPVLLIHLFESKKDDLLAIPHSSRLMQGMFYILSFYGLIFLSSQEQPFIYFQF